MSALGASSTLIADHDAQPTLPDPGPAAPQAVDPGTAFGFHVGEERRYVIGPPDALPLGEGEHWMIRLVSIDGAPPSRQIHFYMEHEARYYERTPNMFSRGAPIVSHGFMDLTVNDHGFPLEARFRRYWDKAPTPNSLEEVAIRFQDGAFNVHNRFSLRFREYQLGVASSPLVDPEIPRGVYVAASENPALYGLVLIGAGIEEAGDVEYMALQPSSYASRGTGGFERPTHESSFSRQRLRFEERTTVEIGGVEEDALRLGRRNGRDIYVRPDGTVLRIDISTRWKHSAFIRLLRPSEY